MVNINITECNSKLKLSRLEAKDMGIKPENKKGDFVAEKIEVNISLLRQCLNSLEDCIEKVEEIMEGGSRYFQDTVFDTKKQLEMIIKNHDNKTKGTCDRRG